MSDWQQDVEEWERFAAEHGIPALLDHLGLDGLANEIVKLRRERDEAREALREWDEWARQAPSEVVMQPLRRWWKQRPVFLHALRDPEPLPPADTDRHPPQAMNEHDPRL